MVLAVLGYLIGGLIIVVGILVLIYEVIMIALSEKDTERINQSARLLTVRWNLFTFSCEYIANTD